MLGKDVAVPSWLTPALTSLVGVVGGKVVGGAVGGDAGGGIGAIGCPLPGGWVSPRVSDFGVDRPHTDVRGWMTVVTWPARNLPAIVSDVSIVVLPQAVIDTSAAITRKRQEIAASSVPSLIVGGSAPTGTGCTGCLIEQGIGSGTLSQHTGCVRRRDLGDR